MTQERLFSAILWLSIASYRYYNFQLDFSTWSPCEAFESFCQEYEPIHSGSYNYNYNQRVRINPFRVYEVKGERNMLKSFLFRIRISLFNSYPYMLILIQFLTTKFFKQTNQQKQFF